MNDKSKINKFYETIFQEALEIFPTVSTYVGEKKHNSQYEITISDAHIKKYENFVNKNLKKAKKMLHLADEKSKLHLNMIILILSDWEEGAKINKIPLASFQETPCCFFPDINLPLNHISNPISEFIEMSNGHIHPFKTTQDFLDFSERTIKFVKFFDIAKKTMLEGIQEKITVPQLSIEKVILDFSEIIKNEDYLGAVKITDLKLSNIGVQKYLKTMKTVFTSF